MKILRDFGKREALIYIIVFLWVSLGIMAFWRGASLSDLAVYFGSLTTYAATYIWTESKRPSAKSGILKPGPSSRREIMIYAMVFIWAIAGIFAIWFAANLEELSVYFFSLTGFVTSWLAGEVYKPEDTINKKSN
jgi:hypothetical protein